MTVIIYICIRTIENMMSKLHYSDIKTNRLLPMTHNIFNKHKISNLRFSNNSAFQQICDFDLGKLHFITFSDIHIVYFEIYLIITQIVV